jgi:hypothetical protein
MVAGKSAFTYMSSSGEMKMSLSEMTCKAPCQDGVPEDIGAGRTDILVLQVLQQLQLSICPLREHRCAEGLHDLLDGNILVGELVSGGAAIVNPSASDPNPKGGAECSMAYQTRPKAPMPTGWRSEYLLPSQIQNRTSFVGLTASYLDVISNVVPKIWARTNSAMAGDGIRCGIKVSRVAG